MSESWFTLGSIVILAGLLLAALAGGAVFLFVNRMAGDREE